MSLALRTVKAALTVALCVTTLPSITLATPESTMLVPGAVRLDKPRDPADLTEIGGVLYFTAGGAGERARGLWRSDGTNEGTYAIETCRSSLACGARRAVRSLFAGGDLLFFTTVDGLWRSDGTNAGTFMVAKDADVADRRRSAVARRFERRRSRGERDRIHDDICFVLPLDGLLYIVAERDCLDPYPQQLWVSDGTLEGTRRLSRDVVGSPGFGPAPSVGDGRRLFFARDGRGSEPWITDGSPSGTRRLRDIRRGPKGSWIEGHQMATLGKDVVFVADDGTHGPEPWVTGGSSAGTQRLADTRSGKRGGVTAAPFVAVADQVFFVANDGIHGRELWVTDGTSLGTIIVRDIRPGTKGAISVGRVMPVGSLVFFVAEDGEHGPQLWRSDGSETGTVRLTDIDGGLSEISAIREAGDRAVALVGDGRGGTSAWTTDGSRQGTIELAMLCTADTDGCELELVFGSAGIAYIDVNGQQVWRSDGTAAGTYDLGIEGRRPEAFQARDRWVYFMTDAGDSRLLWRTDGSRDGTVAISRVTGDEDATPFLPTAEGTFIVHGGDLGNEASCDRSRCYLWFLPQGETRATERTAPTDDGPDRYAAIAPVEGFPERIGDRRVRARHLHGPGWLATFDRTDPDGAAAAEAIEAFVATVGRDITGLRLSYASQSIGGRPTAITAVHLEGADRSSLIDAIIPFLFADTVEASRRRESIAGKRVIRIKDAAVPGSYPRFIYPRGDTVWLIEADRPLLAEILRALP